ncbi:MAG: hypothetical protein IJU72_02910 [Bacteroidales bacterium]|nr:hypothetical protein [Bacteroidales bacterium]
MNRIRTVAATVALALLAACSTSLNADYPKGSAQWELATFIDNLNTGRYDEAVRQMNVNPVANGEITIEEFQELMSGKVTNGGTVSKIELNEVPEEFVANTVRIDVSFTYKDGSSKQMWVNMEQSDTAWHVTTRGTMF